MPSLVGGQFVEVIYCLFFALACFSALMVVLSPHAVHAALYLVLTMVAIAALFILMNAQLAAAFQIIVYAGAIMVLFLFVIMLLNLGHMGGPASRTRGVRALGLLFAAAFGVQVVAVLGGLSKSAGSSATAVAPPSIAIPDVARLLLTDYIYAFEMTSILLLIAVVGSVILARKHLHPHPQHGAAKKG